MRRFIEGRSSGGGCFCFDAVTIILSELMGSTLLSFCCSFSSCCRSSGSFSVEFIDMVMAWRTRSSWSPSSRERRIEARWD